MKILHINLLGDVENIQAEDASEWGIVNLKTVNAALDSMPDAEEIWVHIHSRGGDVDEGFAIHDRLKATGKKIVTITEGLCASIATVIFLAGSERKMTSNSSFFIHCPWTFGMGSADELEKTSEDVRKMEDKMLNFYVAKTGGDKTQISDMMKEQTSLTPEKALEMKFATEIVDTVSASSRKKVYAKINPLKSNNEMSKVVDDIKALLKKAGFKAEETPATPPVKNLDLKLKGEDESLHVQTEAEDPAVGDQVTYKGQATPEKTYELEDGRKVKTDSESKIVDILPPETSTAPAASTPSAEIVAKDAKIAELEKQLGEAKAAQDAQKKTIDAQAAAIAENTKQFEEIKKGLAAITAGTKSGYKADVEETRYSKTGSTVVKTDDVASAVAAYKRNADARRVGKKPALRVERDEDEGQE